MLMMINGDTDYNIVTDDNGDNTGNMIDDIGDKR
jgi:hypothetical protein